MTFYIHHNACFQNSEQRGKKTLKKKPSDSFKKKKKYISLKLENLNKDA